MLFLGESGTGKSTHTRLWREHIPGAELLNDDSPIIRATDSEALGPRIAVERQNALLPQRELPDSRRRTALAGPAQPHPPPAADRVHRALLPSAPPAFARDERLSDDTCGLLSRLIAQVPVYHLECLPDAAAAQLACRTVFNDATL